MKGAQGVLVSCYGTEYSSSEYSGSFRTGVGVENIMPENKEKIELHNAKISHIANFPRTPRLKH